MPGPGESGEFFGNIEDTLKELLGGDLEKTLAEATGKSAAPPPAPKPAAAPPGSRSSASSSIVPPASSASSLLSESGIADAAAVNESSIEDLLRGTVPPAAPGAAPAAAPGGDSTWHGAAAGRTDDSQRLGRALGEGLPEPKRESLKALLKVRLPLRVRLAQKTLPLRDVLGLTEGAIIEFGKPIDSPLDLLVSDHRIATGEAIKVGEKFGLKIRSIADLRDTIRKLGPS